MPRADHIGLQDAGSRLQRINGRVNALFGDLTGEDGGRVQVGEGGGRRGVGQIIRRDIDRLHGGDGAVLRGGDALLQGADFVGQGRLIADRRGHAAHQGGDLGACLHITEDIVDEQEDVLLLLVAEVFGHGQAGQRDAHACAGRLVHLAEDQGGLAQDTRFGHLAPEVVALARALADAGENRISAVFGCDVADKFLDQDGLADACAAEQADFAAARVGRQQVNDLDAGLQDLGGWVLLRKCRWIAVDGPAVGCLDRPFLVDRLAQHVEHAAEHGLTDRGFDRMAGGSDRVAAA